MANRESDIQSQQQPDTPWFWPSGPGKGDNPNIPPGVPGTAPQAEFVVSTFEARPISAYDTFACLNTTNPSFQTPLGYVSVIRALSISAYLQSTPLFSGFTVINRWGYPETTAFPTSVLDLRFDLLLNNVPANKLSNMLINDACMGTLNLGLYLPVDENTTVTPQVRLGPTTAFAGTLNYTVDARFNLLPKTGVEVDSEAANKKPVFVKVQP